MTEVSILGCGVCPDMMTGPVRVLFDQQAFYHQTSPCSECNGKANFTWSDRSKKFKESEEAKMMVRQFPYKKRLVQKMHERKAALAKAIAEDEYAARKQSICATVRMLAELVSQPNTSSGLI